MSEYCYNCGNEHRTLRERFDCDEGFITKIVAENASLKRENAELKARLIEGPNSTARWANKAFDEAPNIPLTKELIDDIVKRATDPKPQGEE